MRIDYDPLLILRQGTLLTAVPVMVELQSVSMSGTDLPMTTVQYGRGRQIQTNIYGSLIAMSSDMIPMKHDLT